jgi:hypothetical protein
VVERDEFQPAVWGGVPKKTRKTRTRRRKCQITTEKKSSPVKRDSHVFLYSAVELPAPTHNKKKKTFKHTPNWNKLTFFLAWGIKNVPSKNFNLQKKKKNRIRTRKGVSGLL